jgi:hypothetical protein
MTYQYAAQGSDNRPFSVREPVTSGDPTRAIAVKDFPFGGVQRQFTHESIYTEPREIANRVYIALFDRPDAVLQLVLPLFPHEGETVNWTEFHAKVRPMPQHAHQAPHETFGMSKTRIQFNMNWHGLMFSLDESIMRTPAEKFLTDAHIAVLQSAMNLTIFIEVIGHIVNQPDMFQREFDFCTKHRANPLDQHAAVRRQIDMMEIMPGILDRGDATENGLGYFMEHAANHLNGFKIDPTLAPNFFMLPSGLSDTLKTKSAAVDSGLSEEHIRHFLRGVTANKELVWSLNPLTAQQFRGVSIIKVDPYDSSEGRRDLLTRTWVEGTCHVIDKATMAQYEIIDYEKRRWVKIWERTQGTFQGADIIGMDPVDNNRFLVAFRPGITLNMHLVVEGIGGRATGMTAFGRDEYESYAVPQVGKREWCHRFRLGVFVAHPEHFCVLPNAKYRDYVRGGSARMAALLPANQYAKDLMVSRSRGRQSAQGPDVAIYKVHPDMDNTINDARLLCAGGFFEDPRISPNDTEFNWIPAVYAPPNAGENRPSAYTNLRSRLPITCIAQHGLRNSPNEKCWVSKGRYKTRAGADKYLYTSNGHGPFRTFDVDAMDVFQNHPRARQSKAIEGREQD